MKLILSLAFSALLSQGWAQELCSQYAAYTASNGYYFNNNAWGSSAGSGSQCLNVSMLLNPGVQWSSEWNWSGGDSNVKGYPYSGRTLSSKQLITNIASMPTKAQWQYGGSNIRADVAYDLFTSSNPNHDTSSGDYELMIWLANKGGVYPIGNSVGTVNVAGQNWDLHVGYNGAMKVFSFVAPSDITTFESDVKPFFSYITENQGFPASQQYLLTFQFGSEVFTGTNARFDAWYFYGEVNT